MRNPDSYQTTSHINVGNTERTLSTIGGILLLIMVLRNRRSVGLLLGVIGLFLLYRGITGFSPLYKLLGINRAVHDEDAEISVPHQQGLRIADNITINRPIAEVYNYLRDFSNFPRFMKHVESVEVKSDKESHWQVKSIAGLPVEWDAVVITEEHPKLIGWRTLKNPLVDHAGALRFKPAPVGQGTEVQIKMEYAPIGGNASKALLTMLGKAPEQQIAEDLRRLKQLLEVGEVATTEGQSSGRA